MSQHPPPSWHALPHWFRSFASERSDAVLLETAKFDEENFRSYLFLDAVEKLTARSLGEVEEAFLAVDRHLSGGLYVAGFVSYNCAEALAGIGQQTSAKLSDSPPFLQLSAYREPVIFDHKTGLISGRYPAPIDALSTYAEASSENAAILSFALDISQEEYVNRVTRVQQYLAAGDSYQVNFTDRISGAFAGRPIALYSRLLEAQPVSYAAFMHCNEYQLLSFSPELFYGISNGTVQVRPMKGTWPRGLNVEDDELAARTLRADAKNRAEHVTIVDLLRNDLGKICQPGTVSVDRLMEVERYSTLHQMTSTISGTLRPGVSSSAVFRALFPCGSITGAPKLRTMEIIRELELNARGLYTGAIGWFGPGGEAHWNVAIRTMTVKKNQFTFGVGGGITADSEPDKEFEECRLKARFLTTAATPFYLFETMRAHGQKVSLLEAHLARLRESARYFQFALDEETLRTAIAQALEDAEEAEYRLRLTLSREGAFSAEVTALEPAHWSGSILLSPQPTVASDVFLHHKTSNRRAYDDAFAKARQLGFDEVFFRNEQGLFTEGAISNIFFLIDGELVTPSTTAGVLPGVQRKYILNNVPGSKCRDITMADMLRAEQIWTCNALRGSRPVETISDMSGTVLWQRLSGSNTALP